MLYLVNRYQVYPLKVLHNMFRLFTIYTGPVQITDQITSPFSRAQKKRRYFFSSLLKMSKKFPFGHSQTTLSNKATFFKIYVFIWFDVN